MEPFYSLLVVMGLNSALAIKELPKLDILSKLPVEIALLILRQLDPRSLLAAALVNRRWLSLCRSDSVLRSRVRRQLRRMRKERIDPVASRRTVLRDVQIESRPFAPRNGQFRVQMPVHQGHQMHASRFWAKSEPQVRMLGADSALKCLSQRSAKNNAASPKPGSFRHVRL